MPSHGPRPGFFKRTVLPLFGPVLQPRFAMGMAMTILSFSMLARFAGINVRQLKPSDLHPAHVWATVDDKVHRTRDRVIKYYESLRFVYEIQTRLREWTAEEEQLDQAVRQGEIGPDEMPNRGSQTGNEAPGASGRERSSEK